MTDSLFEIEPILNSTTYKLEVYYRNRELDQEGHRQISYLNLSEKDLEELTEDNFKEKIDLGFDIRNASQLRYFLSTVYLMKAKAEGLVLVSFDSEDSLACKNWTIDIDYDLDMRDGIEVTQSTEFDEIDCRDEWRSLVFSDAAPNDEDPIREKVKVFDFRKPSLSTTYL